MKFNKRGNKRGLSSIVTTLIIIVLSLVAVGVVWGVVSNLLKSNESQANFQFGTLFLNLKIEKVLIDTSGNVLVSVSRGTGEGDLREIDFIVSDGTNNQLVKRTTILGELGTQLFTLTPEEVGDLSSIYEVSIAPVINSGGTDKIGSKVDTIKSNYYNSCAGILNAGQSNGNGIYTIDPDGLGSGTSLQVYCDVTTDGGGWTLVGRSDPGNIVNDMECTANYAPGVLFGWKVDSGDVNNDNSHYSINLTSKKIKFKEILFGDYSNGKVWGEYIYKQTVPDNFLSKTASYSIGIPYPVKGGNSDFKMARYAGFTDNKDNYHWRDGTSNEYGLSTKGWATCYPFSDSNLIAYGGKIKGRSGMIMVR